MAVISKGGFVRRGFCPPYGGDFVHLVKITKGDYVHPVKSFKGDYVHLVKNMKGISSTYAKMSGGDFVRRGYCPDTLFFCKYTENVNM